MSAQVRRTAAHRDGPDRHLQARLPLPLAQLYGRAVCAARLYDRHEAACDLLDVTGKLSAAIEVARYLDARATGSGRDDPDLDSLLCKLVLPHPGVWNSILLARSRVDDPNDRAVRAPASVLATTRDDLPATRAAVSRLSDAAPGTQHKVTPALLLELLPAHRAKLVAAPAGQAASSLWDATDTLVAAFIELATRTPLFEHLVLAGAQRVRPHPQNRAEGEGEGEIAWVDLRGPQPRRMPPVKMPAGVEFVPGGVYWLDPQRRGLPLHPMVLLGGRGAFCRLYLLDGTAQEASEVRYLDPVSGRVRHPTRLAPVRRGPAG
jgi:hypothetical protein